MGGNQHRAIRAGQNHRQPPLGYIIMVTTLEGLQRKFEVKQRKQNKPTVVLCSSLSQVRQLAKLHPEIRHFFFMKKFTKHEIDLSNFTNFDEGVKKQE